MFSDISPTVGFIFSIVGCLAFGSNFVPVKKYETGDGIFFQWVLCSGIFFSGFVLNVMRNFPPFEPIALLGGALWCTGNLLAVPIIKLVGLSLGLAVWGMANLVTGWTIGQFGLFGLASDPVSAPILNYIGFGLAIISTVGFVFVKPEESKKEESKPIQINGESGETVLVDPSHQTEIPLIPDKLPDKEDEKVFFEKWSLSTKRIVAIILSLISGVLYSANLIPPEYISRHGGSNNQLDYVFSHFIGIYLTSTFFMIVYALAKVNKPVLYPQVITPGFISGFLWSVGQVCFLGANSSLPFTITFPIFTLGPSIVGSIWGILVFGEIRGKNVLMFLGAASVAVIGIGFITLSAFIEV